MAFEVYRPRGEKLEKKAIVSLSKTSVVLNTVARDLLNAKRVEIAFDRESNLMRIKGVTEGGLEIKKTKIFGKGFFNQFDITRKGKFEARFDPEQKAFFVQL